MAIPFPDRPDRPPLQQASFPLTYPHPPTLPLAQAPAPSPVPPRRAGAGRGARVVGVILLCLLSGVAGGLVVRATRSSSTTASPLGVPVSAPAGVPSPSATAPAAPAPAGTIAGVAQAARPSVVTIETRLGEGSGVITGADGLIMTNAHVVNGAGTVTVRLADGTEASGQV